jgi:transposase-like protein
MSHIQTNLSDMLTTFNKDDKCRAYLEQLRWPNGPVCPKCESKNVARLGGREESLRCKDCEQQFTVTVNTIFHDSHLPLTKWFLATYLICESKKGISALQIKRVLGIGGYKTAWYLCHRIREAMMRGTAQESKLSGVVEIDDAYIGGKKIGYGNKAGRDNKTVVVGMTERNGRLRMVVVPSANKEEIAKAVSHHISSDVEMVISDELRSYIPVLAKRFGKKYQKINHSMGFSENGINTNSIENRFSLLKRGIIGSWHKVSAKHLQRYLEEVSFRFSHRQNPYLFSETLLNLLTTDTLTFKALTKKTAA